MLNENLFMEKVLAALHHWLHINFNAEFMKNLNGMLLIKLYLKNNSGHWQRRVCYHHSSFHFCI